MSPGEYHKKLATTISQLKELLKAVDSQNVAAGPSDLIQSTPIEELDRGSPGRMQQQEWRSEDSHVSRIEDNHVGEDGIQIISSTPMYLIQAKNNSAGARSVQCLGQLSDNSIQQVSRDARNRYRSQ